ncbi:MAG: ParB/RepB/Spo0J family partition protein [Clostridiales bacterium]|jgi:ParB family chromosome partitioning protein|nr:ParB/RepB/Spo0J family partition protein [Clostridiales bacterium]MDY4655429.1 ParB/RepB/Spo0J family partition protein [Eubacteriales bacterium]
MAKRVSRGISELLANVEDVREERRPDETKVISVAISKISPDPGQPRKTFNDESLEELALSIKEHGIIQPLIVKKDGNNYLIIAGERRYRAAEKIGLKELPVIVRDFNEQKAREISLIENLQREDLNAIEEAQAIKELMEAYDLTQEEIAKKLGKARPSIANAVRLLNLPESLQDAVKTGVLSAGHARALLAISDKKTQLELATKAIDEGWSVRQIEKEVKYILKPETRPTKLTEQVKAKMSLEMRQFVDDMTRVFATKVRLMGNETKGRIMIDYYTNEDLQRIYELIDSMKK